MRVLFFAQLKDATGCASVELAAPVSISSEQLWSELLKIFPALETHRRTVRLARNSEYVASDAQFADGDEVALIPPVSGG
jgi:molybdopterin converting factor subunit 1